MAKQPAVRRVLAAGPADRPDVPDRDLLRRFAAGNDQEAFAALVRRHAGLVLGVCRRAGLSGPDADDACQAVFLVLARKAGAGGWRPSVANWLYGAARRVARDARVAAARRARREGRAAVPEAVPPVDQMTARELLAALDAELGNLPPAYREPLVLCYLEGLTRDDAAARLGVPTGTVKVRLERGRKRLAAALTRRGLAGVSLLALAATSPAGASPPRLLDAILATALGTPPPAVAALARGVAVTGLLTRIKLAAVALGVAAVGYAALPSAADPEPPAGLAAKPGGAGKADTPPDRPTAVGGTVTGPDGRPAAGAGVFVGYPKPAGLWAHAADDRAVAVRVATAAADGTFRGEVPKDAPPHFWVFATQPGFGVAWEEPKYPDRALTNPDKLTLRLTPDRPIAGRVVDTQGRPVAGAVVGVMDVIEPAGGDLDKLLKGSANGGFGTVGQWEKVFLPPAALGRATTAADGRFEVAGMGADRVVGLTVTGNGLARMSGFVVTRPGVAVGPLNTLPRTSMRTAKGQHPVFYPPAPTLVVEPGYAVEGTVTHKETGRPVPGCRMGLNTGFWDHVTTTTDADGKYRFDGLTKGMRHYVNATPPGDAAVFPTWRDVAEPAGFGTARLDLPLVKGAVFAGRAVDKETKEPVPTSFQIIPAADNPFAKLPEYETASRDMVWKGGGSSDGRFRIVTVPGPSTVNVSPAPTGRLHGRPFRPYRPGQKLLIDLKPDGSPEVTVEVDRGKTAVVRAVDAAGDPVAGLATAGQMVEDYGDSTALDALRLPPADAEFTVYGLGDNDKERRRVVAVQPDRKLGGATFVKPGGRQTLTLHPLQPVRGAFADAGGVPLAGVTVTVDYNEYGLGPLFRDHTKFALSATTDKDGRFEIPDVVPGLPFTFGVQRGDTNYRGTPRLGTRVVWVGKPLDLGTRKLEVAD